jgi:DNA-binding CsgD family transcriptional regulator
MSGPDGILEGMSPRTISAPLVGRTEEIATLRSALAGARDGTPATVLIGGEAGVGKSRLIGEFTTTEQDAGVRVLTGGCLELGADGLPFAPFTAVLRDLVREFGVDGLAGLLPGRGARELARLLPELGEPVTSADAGEARARLFEQILVLLERLAEASPVVLAIEDAHWADSSSRDLLAFLIRNQRALDAVLIIVTYRSDELHRTHPLRPLLAELDRIDWVQRMDLPRLSRREASELATQITGQVPDAAWTDRLYRRTEGNPLFLETLLATPGSGAGPDRGGLTDTPGDLPDSLRDLLLIGVRRLPEESQEVLRIASAGGDRIGHALLAAVSGLGPDRLSQVLRPAVIANTLVTEADDYVFRHALIREAVHDDLLPGEHGRLHARFAEAIDADRSLVPPHRAHLEMAHHWYSAHDVTWALNSAWQAAAEASKSVAHAERLALLARVLELWDQVPDAATRIGADHARVLEEAVESASDAGDAARGLSFASAALKELDPDAEPVRVALLLNRRFGFKHQLGHETNEDLEEALELVPAGVADTARVQILIACGKHGGRHTVRDRSSAEEALALARQIGDPAHEASALQSLGILATGCSGMAEVGSEPLNMVTEARSLATAAKAFRTLLAIATNESHLLEGAGEHEAAAKVARQGAATAEEYGLARTTGTFLAINHAEPLISLGRWDEAMEVIEHARELVPPPMHQASLSVLAGLIAAARGDAEAAGRWSDVARATFRTARYKDQHHLPHDQLEIETRVAAGDLPGAVATAAAALDQHDVLGSVTRYGWQLLTTAARAAVLALGSADGAVRGDAAGLLDRLRDIAGQLEVHGRVQEGHRRTFAALELQGAFELAVAAGPDRADRADGQRDPVALRDAWDEAATAWEAVRQPYPQARALLGAATAALATGDREGAALRLRRAATLADPLRATPLSAEITRVFGRARPGMALRSSPGGASGPGGGAGSGSGSGSGGATAGTEASTPFGLTARELEVLQLVAAGRSNREIAAELFISAKTASVHVSNILGKLEVASRGEAAATAYREGLADPHPEPQATSA